MRIRALFTAVALAAGLTVTSMPGMPSVPIVEAANYPSPSLYPANSLKNLGTNTCLTSGLAMAGCPSAAWKFRPIQDASVGSFEQQLWNIYINNTNTCIGVSGASLNLVDCSVGATFNLLATAGYNVPGDANYAGAFNFRLSSSAALSSELCIGSALSVVACSGSTSQMWSLGSGTLAVPSPSPYVFPLTGANPSRQVQHSDNPWATDMVKSSTVVLYAGGVVVYVAPNNDGCGYGVQVQDQFGFLHTYCHGALPTGLVTGNYYAAGTFVFNSGATGVAGSVHLHYEFVWQRAGSPAWVASSYLPYCSQPALLRTKGNQTVVVSMRMAQSRNGAVLGMNCLDNPDVPSPLIDGMSVSGSSTLHVKGGQVTINVKTRWGQTIDVYDGPVSSNVRVASVTAVGSGGTTLTTAVPVALPTNYGTAPAGHTLYVVVRGFGVDTSARFPLAATVLAEPLVTAMSQTQGLASSGGPASVSAAVNGLTHYVTFEVSPQVAGYSPVPVAVPVGASSVSIAGLTLPPNTGSTAQVYSIHAIPGATQASTNTFGDSALNVVVPAGAGGITLIDPQRLYDSRWAGQTPLVAGIARTVPVASGQVPAGATALQVVVTAVGSTQGGFIRAYPCALGPTAASTLNFDANLGATANSAIVSLDGSSTFCMLSSVQSDVVVDVSGYISASSIGRYNATTPQRLIDTRSAARIGPLARFTAGSVVKLHVPGWDSVPTATGVALYFAAVNPALAGYLNIYAPSAGDVCSSTQSTSVVNYSPATSAARGNSLIVPVSALGNICIFALTDTDLIIDRTGWIIPSSGLLYQPLSPLRILDTRPTLLTAGTYTVDASGKFPMLPGNAVLNANFVVVSPTADGYVIAYADGTAPPATTCVNFNVAQTTSVAGHVQLTNGRFVLKTQTGGAFYLLVDVTGAWVPAPV